MVALTKARKAFQEKVEIGKVYSADEAIAILKEFTARRKFKETVEVAVRLGIDAKKADQGVRGAITLPHGLGKDVKVLVFAEGDNAAAAKKAGADIVGFEDLIDPIKKGELEFSSVIATPNAMKVVGKLGPVLGPRGLMPNPKEGSVTNDVATAVKNAKAGRARFRNDKAGIVHSAIGKIDFDDAKIKENLAALIDALKKAKPDAAKGVYLKKVVLSTTMGPGIMIDLASI